MRRFFLLFVVPIVLSAQTPTQYISPEEIQEELNAAEAQFNRAKKQFNPWYAGPLVTPSASMMPPGDANIQPYFIITANYAVFDKNRHSVPLAHNSYQFSVVTPMQVGITDSTDLIVNPSALANWQNQHSGGGFGDLAVTYGFKIQGETVYIPKFKFTITETFPTGRYKNLASTGLNDSGAGAFQTQFALATGKIIWWSYPYPMNTRLFVGYTISTMVNVSNFNNYGGGLGTKGRVRPGNKWTADFGYELSFSQNWVFALDVVYIAQNSTKFHGKPGIEKDGTPASVGSGYNDNLSLAPAIEYNFSEVFQLLWGVQFSVYGRNSSNFCNGQLSLEYTW